jgi:hypothetical protein
MDKQISDTLLGSPIPTTFKLMGYRHRGMKDQFFGEEAESDEWMNQSKEELAELLVKAEDIIKERENGELYIHCPCVLYMLYTLY